MRYISTFQILDQYVDIYLTDGSTLRLYFNEFSGKAYYRKKLDADSIKHPGIYIGVDVYGNEYVAHNHIDHGRPVLDLISSFTLGMPLKPYDQQPTFPPTEVIRRALNGILTAEKYTLMLFNCQDYVTQSITSRRYSPAVNNSIVGGFAVLGIALIFGGLFGD